MLTTLSRRTVMYQSDAEVWMTGVAPLGTVSHRFHFHIRKNGLYIYIVAILNYYNRFRMPDETESRL